MIKALEESAISYDIVKRCECEFKCGRQSWKDDHAGVAITITTQEDVKEVQDLVTQYGQVVPLGK